MTLLRDNRGRLSGGHWREPKPYYDAEWLRAEYAEKGRSTGEIAAEFGVSDAAILFWLKKHGIPRRTVSEARARKHWGVTGEANPMFGQRGSLNPNYRGGCTPERQRFYASLEWRAVLREVRRRDGWRCQSCDARPSDRSTLHVHHVEPFAERPELRATLDNLTTLCRACHHAAHRRGGDAQ